MIDVGSSFPAPDTDKCGRVHVSVFLLGWQWIQTGLPAETRNIRERGQWTSHSGETRLRACTGGRIVPLRVKPLGPRPLIALCEEPALIRYVRTRIYDCQVAVEDA